MKREKIILCKLKPLIIPSRAISEMIDKKSDVRRPPTGYLNYNFRVVFNWNSLLLNLKSRIICVPRVTLF